MENVPYLEPCLEKKFKGHKSGITSIFYSPNESQIVTGSLDNSLLVWDFRGDIRSYRFLGHDEAVTDVTFTPSGKYIASASRDKTVRLWVPTVTGSTGMFKAHSQTVRSVQFTPDGAKILTSSDDKIVKLWSSDKFKFISSFVGHTNWVRCARVSNDGSIIASCSDDKTTRLWSGESRECVHTYKCQKGHGFSLAWHPSGCYIAIGTSQGIIQLYDVRTHNLVQQYSIHSEAVMQVAFHPSGSYIVTASKDGKMKILDLLEGHPIFTIGGHKGPINAVNFSPSGSSFASAGDDKMALLWKTNFTDLASDMKDDSDKPSARSESQSSKFNSAARSRKQGGRLWYLCYHSTKYPVTTFSNQDNHEVIQESERILSFQEPIANSTINQTAPEILNQSQTNSRVMSTPNNSKSNEPIYDQTSSRNRFGRESNIDFPDDSYSVGHLSHIPRIPPSPSTYSLPSIINKSQVHIQHDVLFGMVKLGENDVCYTSGTIEWVGRKRSFPINSGFKILNGRQKHIEPVLKKVKMDKTYVHDEKDCDCADVLPTVNAIVDHLNALHEAVDIVDLRLNTLEDVITNKTAK